MHKTYASISCTKIKVKNNVLLYLSFLGLVPLLHAWMFMTDSFSHRHVFACIFFNYYLISALKLVFIIEKTLDLKVVLFK